MLVSIRQAWISNQKLREKIEAFEMHCRDVGLEPALTGAVALGGCK